MSVAAKMSESGPQERVDVLTPSSLPSTTSPAEQSSYVSDTLLAELADNTIQPSPGQTLLQALGSHQLRGTTTDFPQSLNREVSQLETDVTQGWSPSSDSPFAMPAPALATTDEELRPQVRYNGSKKCSLPPVQGGLFLLQEFLVDFNAALPLFDPAVITSLFQDCYNGRANGKPIEWVALKVVLGIAHRLRAMSPLGVPQDTENAEIYLQESLDTVPELLVLRPSLLLAQCFVGLAVVISTSSRPYPAQMFVSLALRVVQDLRVNDPERVEPINPAERVQQQRVFWLAYFMEVDMSLRAGRLPHLPPRLINVELPRDGEPDGVGEITAAGGEFKVNIFRLHVELALLQAEFGEQLSLPRPAQKSDGAGNVELRAINSRLEEWRRNWIFELDAEHLRASLHRSDLVHVVVLESTYFSTVYAFWADILPAPRTSHNAFSAQGLIEGMSKQKAQILHKDARRFIDLLRLIPGDDIASNWLSLETIVSALVVILAHIIFNPLDESSVSDFGVSRHMLQILHRLSNISKDDGLVAIQNLCVDLYLRAERALQGDKALRR
ncbi:uncharacterized protein Z520_01545 [Fonsecaea multimorphosa CBS 102226]|uniref:Xylanolytic transcriptional activator regulatory domain-containing protein n=1 Tax=Fonsecaea multimorphosa CBS 102226 TaxID=1442371 RepID=A0A0D2KAN6_9EURO|nr:uncharacterized protein Z520_01545 [Fonsecaea multimorphosa CBS 102226]KIY03078.1 hypothetical protein Z520_01545 [Fonsecaea multimorphosa CBS 102226]OAL30327.1 hypothetical protein AYO22_01524 [Fonsecaea multimorphosa]